MRKDTRKSCRQGLIVFLGLSRCLAGAVILPDIVVTVLVVSGLTIKSVETAILCIPYLSQACSIMAFR